MNKELIEIDDISQIETRILKYNIIDDKLEVYTNDEKYIINYSMENEEKVIQALERSLEQYENDIIDKNDEIKLFEKGLSFIGLYFVLMFSSIVILPNIISLIMIIPAIYYGINVNNILKQLEQEALDLYDEKYKASIILDSKKADFEFNKKLLLKQNVQVDKTIDELKQIKNIIENLDTKDKEETQKTKRLK